MENTHIEYVTEDDITCKYCLEPILIAEHIINPCACTQPVCLDCLCEQIHRTGQEYCEICKKNYEITRELAQEINEYSIAKTFEDYNKLMIEKMKNKTEQINQNNNRVDDNFYCKICGAVSFILCIILFMLVLGYIIVITKIK